MVPRRPLPVLLLSLCLGPAALAEPAHQHATAAPPHPIFVPRIVAAPRHVGDGRRFVREERRVEFRRDVVSHEQRVRFDEERQRDPNTVHVGPP